MRWLMCATMCDSIVKSPDLTIGLLGLIGAPAILAMISETKHSFS